jgi:hypothetical protein
MHVVQVLRADEEASEVTIAQGRVAFKTGEMTAAGQHTFVAEWREHRVGLAHVHERSPAATATVSPGRPADAQVPVPWRRCVQCCFLEYEYSKVC